MSAVNRAIILAAGRGNQLDGMVKALIRHPKTGKTVLDHAVEAFGAKQITVAVGFRAVQIMDHYPELDYVINHEWAITSNAMSLGLALTDESTYVVSGDIFFDRSLIERLDEAAPDLALVDPRENRIATAIHCMLGRDGIHITETYRGAMRDVAHPEAIGLFKISDKDLLRRWKKDCIDNANVFAGQTLPCDGAPVHAVPRANDRFDEINMAADYLRLLEQFQVDSR